MDLTETRVLFTFFFMLSMNCFERDQKTEVHNYIGNINEI